MKNLKEEENNRTLLEAKIQDQYNFSIMKNKITNTDFLNVTERAVAQKFLKENHIQNYVFFGGNGEDSDRVILLFYPEKLTHEMVEKNYSKILSVLRITLSEKTSYEHRIYLSGMMKLGIKREKIGDILVHQDGADIIVLNEVIEFLKNNLSSLTRFRHAHFAIVPIQDVRKKPKQFEDISIIVSSMRLDNFVAELARTSRTKAVEIINQQRVFVNNVLETKFAKKINPKDIINIRGKGKFIVDEIDRTTKSDKYVINIKKFI